MKLKRWKIEILNMNDCGEVFHTHYFWSRELVQWADNFAQVCGFGTRITDRWKRK